MLLDPEGFEHVVALLRVVALSKPAIHASTAATTSAVSRSRSSRRTR